MYVPSKIISSDAATTAAQLRTNDSLFRLGFAAYLAEAFNDVVLAWLFYVLLKPVHRELALLSAFFGLVSMAVFAVTQMFYFSAPMFLTGTPYLTAFLPHQLDAFATLFVSLYARLSGLFMLFYGTAWIIRGWLTWKSTYLPRWLGALMILAGVGFVAKNITKVLAPAYSSNFLIAPMALNAVVVAMWMLTMGVNQERWRAAIAGR